MAQITLSRRECERDLLPSVCAVCGEPADARKRKTFSWHTPLAYLGLLAGLLPFIIIALILTKRMTVHVPLCERHRSHWLWRSFVVVGGLLAIFALGIGIFVYQANQQPPDDLGWLCIGWVGLLIVWLFMAAIVQTTAIRAVEITDERIRLTRIHQDFIHAIEEDRDRHRDERRERRREYNDVRDDYDDSAQSDEPPRRRPRRDDDRFDDEPRRRRD